MVLLAAYFEKQGGVHLIIAQDKEEAAYLNSDLQNLLGTQEHGIFPSSYKRPYQYEEIDNANVLQRAELLNQLIETKGSPRIVITYPEALYEKVFNKRALIENTFIARVGEAVDLEFVTEILTSYDLSEPTSSTNQGNLPFEEEFWMSFHLVMNSLID
jgi:transcription-repair coupling factor (superfamily II helicase)